MDDKEMKRKVLIIGLDGGDWLVLKRIFKYAKLPNLQRLIKEGFSGPLNSTVPANTPTSWSSFQTGMGPGQTGIFDFSYWLTGEKKTGIVTADSLPTTLWQRLSREGKRVGSLNVPLTFPPKKINGQLVSGLLTPSLESNFTWPPSLKKELLTAVPGYHIFNLKTIKEGDPHRRTEEFVGGLNEIVKNRFKAAKYLLETYQYDLFMVHFQATDVGQHVLWGYLDPENPLFDRKKAQFIARKLYASLDRYIGQLIEIFRVTQKAEPLTVVLSDHGFEAHKKRFELGRWLAKHGYLEINSLFFKKSWRRFYRRFLKQQLIRLKISSLKEPDPFSAYFRWDRTTAFSVGRSGEGFIYLIDKRVKKKLINDLKQIQDPATGQRIIKRIWPKEELYRGEQLAKLPDLILEPISGYSFTGTPDHPNFFHQINPRDDFHIGKHRREGILIVDGPGLGSGSLKAEIVDILPSLLYYLKAPIDSKIDGRVIKEIFNDL
jgi:predicted AlkP superfamily phosphohydrolase/phosphomutase